MVLCDKFDPHLPLITEEIGANVKLRDTEDEVVCFSDPLDRSRVLVEFLTNQSGKIETVFKNEKLIKVWESKFGGDIELSGPYGSITATRNFQILFNVMINYVTGMIYVASDEGVGKLLLDDLFEDKNRTTLKRTRDLIHMLSPIKFNNDQELSTSKIDKFVTFCSGEEKYRDNLVSSKIFGNKTAEQIFNDHLIYKKPGGPARILYLQNPSQCGFILSNGERIGEWLGWLAYVKHRTSELCAFEISFESSWTRDQILMSPGKAYSIFLDDIRDDGGNHVNVRLNMSKLRFLENPSIYRATILICPKSNKNIIRSMLEKRRIELRFKNPE